MVYLRNVIREHDRVAMAERRSYRRLVRRQTRPQRRAEEAVIDRAYCRAILKSFSFGAGISRQYDAAFRVKGQ